MSEPVQTCQLCGNKVFVTLLMRGRSLDTAEARLKRLCNGEGCPCDPKYTAGVDERVRRILEPFSS